MMYVSVTVWLPAYLPAYLPVCLYFCLSVCRSVYISVYLSVCLSIFLSICLIKDMQILYITLDTHNGLLLAHCVIKQFIYDSLTV